MASTPVPSRMPCEAPLCDFEAEGLDCIDVLADHYRYRHPSSLFIKCTVNVGGYVCDWGVPLPLFRFAGELYQRHMLADKHRNARCLEGPVPLGSSDRAWLSCLHPPLGDPRWASSSDPRSGMGRVFKETGPWHRDPRWADPQWPLGGSTRVDPHYVDPRSAVPRSARAARDPANEGRGCDPRDAVRGGVSGSDPRSAFTPGSYGSDPRMTPTSVPCSFGSDLRRTPNTPEDAAEVRKSDGAVLHHHPVTGARPGGSVYFASFTGPGTEYRRNPFETEHEEPTSVHGSEEYCFEKNAGDLWPLQRDCRSADDRFGSQGSE